MSGTIISGVVRLKKIPFRVIFEKMHTRYFTFSRTTQLNSKVIQLVVS